jgi:AmmeMemoRadiSam system protein B
MVPEVGGEMISEVRGSIEAMRELTRRVVACGAETVVIISPHAPLEPSAFVAYAEPNLRGDFAQFRAPQAEVNFPLDSEMLAAVVRSAAEDGFAVLPFEGYPLDHGTAVPLYFLQSFGWEGRVVALGYSFLSNEDHLRFGASVRRAAETLDRKVSFIASGDLSHRLKPSAPAGYRPDAHLFDEQVVAAIKSAEPARIARIDQNLRRTAGECGYRSMLVSLGVMGDEPPGCEVLHYEAPFGVGYMVAQLLSKEAGA